MNKQPILLTLLLPCFFAATLLPASNIQFLSGDPESFQSRALRENKLLFVHFTASWCMPCQWMEKHTFRDEKLAAMLNGNFLSIKIDIDNRQGLQLKNNFRISHLPTSLIIDQRGVVIGRYESSLTASQLLALLAEGLEQQRPVQPSAPAYAQTRLQRPPLPGTAISRPALLPSPGARRQSPQVLGHTPADPAPAAEPLAHSTTTASSTPAPAKRRNYGVQIGVFGSYDNAIRQAEFLEQRLDQPVNIFVSEHQSKKVYRILVGVFPTTEGAQLYANQLQGQSIKGIIKDLDSL